MDSVRINITETVEEVQVNITESVDEVKVVISQALQGDAGISAYQVAVDNGYEGTKSQWLASLHGADSTEPGPVGYTPIKGVDYFDGDKGDKGDKGNTGNAGYTPIKGVDYFDGTDGENWVNFDGGTPSDVIVAVESFDFGNI